MSYRNIHRIIIQTIENINKAIRMDKREKYKSSKEMYKRYKVGLDNCINNGSYVDGNGVKRNPRIIITGMHDL